MKRTFAALLLCALSACKHEGGGVSDAGAPFHPSARPTTHPSAISITNLDGDVADAERRMQRGEAFFTHRLPGLLVERAGYLGTVDDYDEADDVSAKNAAASPSDGAVRFARAKVLGALHRFDDAIGELDAAAAHGAAADEVAASRATIMLALGRCAEAATLWPNPGLHSEEMTVRGSIEQRLGHAALAETLFERARLQFLDVSPFRLGWMDFERARAAERQNDLARARVWLEEALDIFPEYAHAAVHVEPLEAPERAITRLEIVEKRATDPDVFAAHADALRRLKRDNDARPITERARQRFEELLAKHPEAYADHAARFFLGAGGDVKRALELARSAATRSPNEETLELWALAARAASVPEDVCKALSLASKSSCMFPPALEALRKTCR